MDRSVARLASGQRITTAADDAAGVAISENLRSKQRSTAQALRNGNDGIALLQTALSSHHQISDRLIRMRELAVQASSDTLTINDRKGITKEFNLSTNDIDRIALVSEFNGVELMTGTAGTNGKVFLQVSTESGISNGVTAVLKAINSSVLGIDAAKLTNAKFSRLAIIAIDKALGKMGIREANIGADINQIAAAVDQLGNQDVLLQQAHSQIRDADVGREAAEMRRHQVQLQATTAMQAQANAAGSMVLRLLE
jgi:flagellin